MTNVSLEITGLTKIFDTPAGPYIAVKDVHARLSDGEFVCIVGHSGCGREAIAASSFNRPRFCRGFLQGKTSRLPWGAHFRITPVLSGVSRPKSIWSSSEPQAAMTRSRRNCHSELNSVFRWPGRFRSSRSFCCSMSLSPCLTLSPDSICRTSCWTFGKSRGRLLSW